MIYYIVLVVVFVLGIVARYTLAEDEALSTADLALFASYVAVVISTSQYNLTVQAKKRDMAIDFSIRHSFDPGIVGARKLATAYFDGQLLTGSKEDHESSNAAFAYVLFLDYVCKLANEDKIDQQYLSAFFNEGVAIWANTYYADDFAHKGKIKRLPDKSILNGLFGYRARFNPQTLAQRASIPT